MKRFYVNIIGLILGFIIIDRVVGFVMEYFIENQKSHEIYEAKTKVALCPEIAILGSSRAEGHYNASIISDSMNKYTINYGIPGTGTITQLFMLENILSANKKLKLVILDIKPYEFNDAFDAAELNKIYPLFVHNEALLAHLKKYDHAEYLKIQSKMFRYNNMIVSLFRGYMEDKRQDSSFLKFSGFPKAKTLPTCDECEFLNVHNGYLQSINDIIKITKENNIDLVFSVSPIFARIKKSRTIEVIDSISKVNNIPFINNAAAYVKMEENVLYRDYKHLNEDGANKFNKEILVPQLKNILKN
ncbi:hypothetical protein [Polluticaenibacter yanchengensis]|uniref:SGNH/GDSL hydrolase family protein n=1 Tax=Polluticaenibacter yanchengensis TaxID=3014562 RepID=A0ABT4UP97_9BACT|nr:hypothetical protein [Chitinophagaceae bacterium LY-5]